MKRWPNQQKWGDRNVYIVSVRYKRGDEEGFLPALCVFRDAIRAHKAVQQCLANYADVSIKATKLQWRKEPEVPNTQYVEHKFRNGDFAKVWLTGHMLQRTVE